MIESNFIRQILLSYLARDVKDYIIYPFGINGIEVKKILEECFGIMPRLIVDNTNSLYNPNIINYDKLKQEIGKDDYVILTIENKQLNNQMEMELEEIIDKEKIINLSCLYEKKNMKEDSNFSLRNILPLNFEVNETNIENGNNRIKVRVLHTTLSTWNSLKTICMAFEKDTKYDLKIILGEVLYRRAEIKAAEKQMRAEDMGFFLGRNYRVEEDKPDIFIVSHPWDDSPYYKVRNFAKLVIMASMVLNEPSDSINNFLETLKYGVEKYGPDFYLFDTLTYNELNKVGYMPGKLIHMGNAKYDGIYHACKEKKIPVEWKKLENRKIILWTTDHGINHGNVDRALTFDLYAKGIFKYAKENENMGFIFRPHPSLIKELTEQGYWSVEDLEEMKEYCNSSSNIIFDDTDCYDAAYSASDAILADSACGIICSALPTLKPICVTFRSKEIEPCHKEIVNNYYSAYNIEELIEFFEMIKEDRDPMLEQRKRISKKYVKHFDGKNGERIKDFIVEEYKKL